MVAFGILFLVLLVFSIYIGFALGSSFGAKLEDSGAYWKANLAGVGVAVLVTAVVSLLPLLAAAPIGMLGGWIAGLKMGFGESVGPWKVHDRVFNVNRSHTEAAKRGTGRARRRRARAGESGPDLISVGDDGVRNEGSRGAADGAPAQGNDRER